MSRSTVYDFRASSIPSVLGSVAADLPRLCEYLNQAQRRLILAGGETGWWGGWYKMAFNVDQTNPYITAGRQIARLIGLTICSQPVRIQNEFYEFLEAGIGTQPQSACAEPCGILETYDRGSFPTMVDIPTTGLYKLRVYPTDTRDLGKRILFSGTDQNDVVVRNRDGLYEAPGEFVTLGSPFVDTISAWHTLTGVQKDVTFRDVLVYAFNVATGAEILLSRYGPDETVPAYRRYYINNLPLNCCGSNTVQVLGMAKLEFVPVRQDTDFLVIGNLDALKEECMSIRFGEMDNMNALTMAKVKHGEAIRLLNQELTHYLGRNRPAIVQPLFGTATLENVSVGSLI